MTDQTAGQQPPPAAPPAPSPAPSVRPLAEIAKSMYGDQFKGDASPKSPDADEAPAPKVEPKSETDDEPEGDQQTTEEPEGEDLQREQREPDSTSERPIESVAELVEHLEADPEWANSLKVAVKVDGRQTDVPLGDLIASYQKQEMAEQYLNEAREAKHSTTKELAERKAAQEAEYRVLAEMIQANEAALEHEAKQADETLRQTDPSEWAARQLEFGQRRAWIAQMKQTAITNWQANAQKQTAEFATAKNAYRAQQEEVLLDKLPEWRDPSKAEAEKTKLVSYLSNLGFTTPDFDNLIDHRQVLLFRKAMLYDESRGKIDAATKRVVTVPKMMKPGAPKAKEQIASERLQKLKETMQKTGTPEAAFAYRMAKRGASR